MELFLCEQTSDANASWRDSLRAVLEGRLSPPIRWIVVCIAKQRWTHLLLDGGEL